MLAFLYPSDAIIPAAISGKLSAVTSISPNNSGSGCFSYTVHYAPLNPVRLAAETSHICAAANHGFSPPSVLNLSNNGRYAPGSGFPTPAVSHDRRFSEGISTPALRRYAPTRFKSPAVSAQTVNPASRSFCTHSSAPGRRSRFAYSCMIYARPSSVPTDAGSAMPAW